MAIQISGTNVIDNSRNLTNIANATTAATANTYVIRDASGNIPSSSLGNIPIRGNDDFQGGSLISISSGVYWIVAPDTSEVSRSWYARNDANTRAQQVSGCTGWFVPTMLQLDNTGYRCRSYWDSYSYATYWSSTQISPTSGAGTNFFTGGGSSVTKTCTCRVRAFRCVTY